MVGDKGATELAGLLRNNTVLTQLSLPDVNFVGDRGATELAGALRNNTVLTQLRLPRVNCKKRRHTRRNRPGWAGKVGPGARVWGGGHACARAD